MTDTQRTATEQMLISQAIDRAVSQLDFSPLAGKSVFFDSQYLDGVVDRGYLVSSLRQYLLASGCMLQEERAKATYVVEVRCGGTGTDRHSLLIGIPQMTVPALVPGQPSQIPEIPVAKKNDQQGVAKIALFAFNRTTGEAVWQSGVVQATSTARDTWVMGTGPFQRGTIRQQPEFAGVALPLPGFSEKVPGSDASELTAVPLTRPASWLEPRPGREERPVTEVLTRAVLDERNPAGQSPAAKATASEPKGAAAAPSAPNSGGYAETEPAKVISTGAGFKPDK
jgi:hypothetical protein